MKTIKYVLKMNGNTATPISPNTTVHDALKRMVEQGESVLPVLENGKFVGVISEVDSERNIFLVGDNHRDNFVKDVMDRTPVYTSPDRKIEECMEVMTAQKIQSIPVLSGDKYLGMVSIGDLARIIISDQKEIIHKLEEYILENTFIT